MNYLLPAHQRGEGAELLGQRQEHLVLIVNRVRQEGDQLGPDEIGTLQLKSTVLEFLIRLHGVTHSPEPTVELVPKWKLQMFTGISHLVRSTPRARAMVESFLMEFSRSCTSSFLSSSINTAIG